MFQLPVADGDSIYAVLWGDLSDDRNIWELGDQVMAEAILRAVGAQEPACGLPDAPGKV